MNNIPEEVEAHLTQTQPEAEAVTSPAPQPSPSPDEVNSIGARSTTGPVTDDGRGAAFFSAADVRAMSREQVRANLDKILKSMESPEF